MGIKKAGHCWSRLFLPAFSGHSAGKGKSRKTGSLAPSLGVDLALLHSIMKNIHHHLVVPAKVEGLFGPHGILHGEVHIVLAALADIDIGDVEIIPCGNRIFDGLLAYITIDDLHAPLLRSCGLWLFSEPVLD